MKIDSLTFLVTIKNMSWIQVLLGMFSIWVFHQFLLIVFAHFYYEYSFKQSKKLNTAKMFLQKLKKKCTENDGQ